MNWKLRELLYILNECGGNDDTCSEVPSKEIGINRDSDPFDSGSDDGEECSQRRHNENHEES